MKRVLLAAFLAIVAWGAHATDEPLQPEQAFRLTVRALDARTLEARWRIADGYYLYRDKLRFEVEPASARLGSPRLPPGETREDEFFGKTAIYRNEAVVVLPLATRGGARSITLKTYYQGCAEELGVCYPLSSRSIRVALPREAAGRRRARSASMRARRERAAKRDSNGDADSISHDPTGDRTCAIRAR